MIILGIESSCDETGVALVDAAPQAGPQLLAHALHTQAAMHNDYGGVVPELASRDHIRRLIPLTREVLTRAGKTLAQVDLVAYTRGPGLAGALLVGAGFGEALAMALDKPAMGIHHLEGHLLSAFLSSPVPEFPFVALLVSGGHTQLLHVQAVGRYTLLGETIDDAAGEAFDKSAKLLGLGYPGGAALSGLAQQGNPQAIRLPRPLMHSHDLDFSFAGLKTAVATQWHRWGDHPTAQQRADLAAATQEAIVDVLVHKSLQAMDATGCPRLVVAGGVGANARLRQVLRERVSRRGATLFFPELAWCGDNGAMIAWAAAMRIRAWGPAAWTGRSFHVLPRWPLQGITGPNGQPV